MPKCKYCDSNDVRIEKLVYGQQEQKYFHYKLYCTCGRSYLVKRDAETYALVKDKQWLKPKERGQKTPKRQPPPIKSYEDERDISQNNILMRLLHGERAYRRQEHQKKKDLKAFIKKHKKVKGR